jgi:hypothetical protein
MSRITVSILAAVLVGFIPVTSAEAAEPVSLAEMDGWDIVIPQDPILSEKYSAEQFQHFFEQASGIKLPIAAASDRSDKHVFIGESEAMRSSSIGFSTEQLGDEDLRIVVRDGNIAIAGGRPRGTLYGVYTFLEDYLGVRFLTRDHIHVPPVGDWRVVGPIDRFYHPPFEYRNASYGENTSYHEHAARLRNNATPKDPKLGGHSTLMNVNHSLYRQIPMEKYQAEHPEYFALLGPDYKGRKGTAGQRSTNWDAQVCLTNPHVLKIVTAAVLKELENRPDARNISVSQNDGYGYCECENCAAIDEREGTQMGSLLTFVNGVADDIAKTHPDVMVGTLAYNYSQKPPKTIKPRPNVQIHLCSVRCNVLYPIRDPTCAQNEGFRQVLEDWKKVCDYITVWNYNLNHWHEQLPNPNMEVVEHNIRFFAANNVRGVFLQSPEGVSTEMSDLKNYVNSRLLWDPNQSGERLRDEFLTLHYGRAADPIRRFLRYLHENAREKTKGREYVHFAGWRRNVGIDDAFIHEAMKLFDEALSVADNEVIRDRVEKASICVYAAAAEDAYRWSHTAFYDGKGEYETRPIDPSLAKTRPYARRYFELCRKHGVTRWPEGMDIYSKPLRFVRRAYGLKEGEPL